LHAEFAEKLGVFYILRVLREAILIVHLDVILDDLIVNVPLRQSVRIN